MKAHYNEQATFFADKQVHLLRNLSRDGVLASLRLATIRASSFGCS
jgi:hypothetical protein